MVCSITRWWATPPYIVVKDAALNAAYRRKYASCHMKYSLGAPFTERFFELAETPKATGGNEHGAGYIGLITANSFMKREFGSKLIEQVLPRLDLTHVVDTSGAYIRVTAHQRSSCSVATGGR